MLQNPCKTLGFKKNMVYKIPPRGGGKPYPASGLYRAHRHLYDTAYFLSHAQIFKLMKHSFLNSIRV